MENLNDSQETPKDSQENELQALLAIFGDDIEDLRPKGKKWKPLKLRIRLTPQKGSSGVELKRDYVFCSLHVTCPARYPIQIAPKLQIENSKGLSDALLQQLLGELEDQANKLVSNDEVVIYELTQTIQAFLHQHNQPPRGSFYDEMISSQQRRDKVRLQIKADEEEQKRQQLRDEFLKRKEQLKSEQRIHRNTLRKSFSESSPTHSTENYDSSTDSSRECLDHKGSDFLNFTTVGRKFQKGNCLGHSIKGCVTFSGIDTETGQLVYITEWNFKHTLLEQRRINIDEFVNTIEREISNLSTLRHNNLIAYECVLCLRKKDHITVLIVQDFILGTSVSSISSYLGWANEGASFVAKGVLNAIIYLHNNGVTHKSLFDSAVYMDNSGRIRVSDFSLIPYLQEVYSGQKQTIGDLCALGALIESLSPTPHTEMRDFIEKCKSERTLSASDLVDHPFLRPVLYPEPRKKDNNYVLAIERPHSTQPLPLITPEKSRLQTEFKVLTYLGKGAYGDVLKVLNILDNRQYAIKRIPLSAKSKQIFRKMTREVELLSRLHHENVVRYYNSWIESAIQQVDLNLDDFSTNDYSISQDSRKTSKRIPCVIQEKTEESAESDWIDMHNRDSSSDGIEFVNSDGEVANHDDSDFEEEESEKRAQSRNEIQYMYIQMEFCEKSTLRTAIDDGLHNDIDRLWRLFREICEGLLHIHQQGMIHRDLKPVNIFLDSHDQVKIGDFGLATTSILALQDTSVTAPHSIQSGSMTGRVGTALYVAPELSGNASKSTYNQKVDLYSLGIILFEMSTPPPATAMERVNVILSLRSQSIVFPDYMLNDAKFQQVNAIIKKLLDHDAKERPTADQLLNSNLMPPAKMETNELHEMLRHVLAAPESRNYKHLIARCLAQESDILCEMTYHMDMMNIYPLFELVKTKIANLFTKHGAIEVMTPLLTPYTKNNNFTNAVRLMTHSGSVVTLPHDLRWAFIRFVALSGISYLRRYSIGRVYREKKVFNFHPKQIHEAAFDVITHNRGNLLVDAELIATAFDITNELKSLQKCNITFRMNHTSLLRAIFSYCNVPTDSYAKVISYVDDFLDGKISKFQLTNSLSPVLNMSRQSATLLIDLLLVETTVGNLDQSALKTLTKGRCEDAQLAKGAIKELQMVISMVYKFGVTCTINIATGFCGGECFKSKGGAIIWQMNGEIKTGRESKHTTLAAGGRYDSLLIDSQKTAMANGISFPNREINGAGFSFALDKIVYAIRNSEQGVNASMDVVVCVNGSRPPLQDVIQILRGLWSAKIKAGIIESNNSEEAVDLAKEINAKIMILLSEGGVLRVRSLERGQFQERHITRPDLIVYIQRMLSTPECQLNELNIGTPLSATTPSAKAINIQNSSIPTLELIFTLSEKTTATKRRRFESQIEQNLSQLLSKFAKKQKISMVVVDLPAFIIKAFISIIDIVPESSSDGFASEQNQLIEMFPKQKRYISEILSEITDVLSDTKNPSIVGLYSTTESYYRLFL